MKNKSLPSPTAKAEEIIRNKWVALTNIRNQAAATMSQVEGQILGVAEMAGIAPEHINKIIGVKDYFGRTQQQKTPAKRGPKPKTPPLAPPPEPKD